MDFFGFHLVQIQIVEHLRDVPDKIRPRLFIFNPTRFEDVVGDVIDFVGYHLVFWGIVEYRENIGRRGKRGQCPDLPLLIVLPESLPIPVRDFRLVEVCVNLLLVGVTRKGVVAIVDF